MCKKAIFKDGTDINFIVKDMRFVILNGAVGEEFNKGLDIQNMIIVIKKLIIDGMIFYPKQCITAIMMWNRILQEIIKGNSNQKIIKYQIQKPGNLFLNN